MRNKLLRRLRKQKGLTLADLGAQTGYTPSYLSQLERGLKRPSLDALRRIADALGAPVISLLDEEIGAAEGDVARNAQCSIVRGHSRRRFMLEEEGTVIELLTPQDEGDSHSYAMHGMIATTQPGTWTNQKPVSHFYEECCYILSGTMQAVVGGESYDLETGDSLYIDSFALHNFYNSGKELLVVIAFQSH